MILTFEYDPENVVEVNLDEEGRDFLIGVLGRLVAGDHEHLATPDWGGPGLTPEFPNQDLTPVHQVTIQMVSHLGLRLG